MPEMRYFQIEGVKYTHTGFQVGQASAVAFQFFMCKDDGDRFDMKVLFSTQVLNLIGKSFSLGIPFLQESERPRFLRYAFYRLERQLEESNLNSYVDIVVDHTEADSLRRDWPKQCDSLVSDGKNLFCHGNIDGALTTSLESCRRCVLPEPLFRCDNLRVQGVTESTDSKGERQITPQCICSGGHKLPNDIGECTRHAGRTCFIPFRFYLPPPEYPSRVS